jgi:CheY-like chemotaxis protein
MNIPKKVLIAEDDEAVRHILKVELEKCGLTVFEAPNGEAAISMAFAERPNLILLDILMPKMHGMEILRKIQEKDWGKKIPIILLTNFADDPRVIEAVREGRCDVLRKAETKLEDVVSIVLKKISASIS